jgi:insertion element IS1 protein InsB
VVLRLKLSVPTQALVAEVEVGELWSFVLDKSHQCWFWWAIDYNTGVPLVYCFGTREHKRLDELRALFASFMFIIVYCADNSAYETHVKESIVCDGERNTQCIECKHLSLCTWCSRLVRKGICFSESLIMHKIVVGLIINFWFFKRDLLFHLT